MRDQLESGSQRGQKNRFFTCSAWKLRKLPVTPPRRRQIGQADATHPLGGWWKKKKKEVKVYFSWKNGRFLFYFNLVRGIDPKVKSSTQVRKKGWWLFCMPIVTDYSLPLKNDAWKKKRKLVFLCEVSLSSLLPNNASFTKLACRSVSRSVKNQRTNPHHGWKYQHDRFYFRYFQDFGVPIVRLVAVLNLHEIELSSLRPFLINKNFPLFFGHHIRIESPRRVEFILMRARVSKLLP